MKPGCWALGGVGAGMCRVTQGFGGLGRARPVLRVLSSAQTASDRASSRTVGGGKDSRRLTVVIQAGEEASGGVLGVSPRRTF